ncbi:MAG: hypothetical protein AB8H79_06475 [Myxococcota bacterium]
MDLLNTLLPRLAVESPTLGRRLASLNEPARVALEAVLSRFDPDDSGLLNEGARAEVSRILVLLDDPADAASLQWLTRVLDLFDIDGDSKIDAAEFADTMDILNEFRRANADALTLSARALELLVAALTARDLNGNGRIEPEERRALREALGHFDTFWQAEQERNPRFAELLA